MSPRTLAVVLAAVAAVLVLWLWPRGPVDPEQQIRKLVGECVAGAEKKDIGPLADAMAESFRGPGGASKQEVKQIVAFQVLRNTETVAIFNPALDVSVKGADDAEIDGTFLFTRSKAKNVEELGPGTVASAYRIHAVLTRDGKDWKFVSATYEAIAWP